MLRDDDGWIFTLALLEFSTMLRGGGALCDGGIFTHFRLPIGDFSSCTVGIFNYVTRRRALCDGGIFTHFKIIDWRLFFNVVRMFEFSRELVTQINTQLGILIQPFYSIMYVFLIVAVIKRFWNKWKSKKNRFPLDFLLQILLRVESVDCSDDLARNGLTLPVIPGLRVYRRSTIDLS